MYIIYAKAGFIYIVGNKLLKIILAIKYNDFNKVYYYK